LKTKDKGKQPTNQNQVVLECFDQINSHRSRLETIATLLTHCGKGDVGLTPETVCSVGHMFLDELAQIKVCLSSLAEVNQINVGISSRGSMR